MQFTFDAGILQIVDAAFGQSERPAHFTVEDGDPECMEYDELFHSNTRESLPISPFYTPSPLSELLPDGMKYYFPALARFALSASGDDDEWSGSTLLYKLMHDEFMHSCNGIQRKAVHDFIVYIKKTRLDFVLKFISLEDLEIIIKKWDG